VAQELKQAGYDDVKALLGGLDAWIRAGGPLERKSG
jgi:rhodanese-related sulfurtransferase